MIVDRGVKDGEIIEPFHDRVVRGNNAFNLCLRQDVLPVSSLPFAKERFRAFRLLVKTMFGFLLF
ncbi:MAG: hypothetical protein SGI73_19325, partial [Chloroflexota bacterium]|nr:hypothetical protein [Chloroflexota bacterium]